MAGKFEHTILTEYRTEHVISHNNRRIKKLVEFNINVIQERMCCGSCSHLAHIIDTKPKEVLI